MKTREPDFSQILKVLKGERPARPVLFELFMNERVYTRFSGRAHTGDKAASLRRLIDAYAAGGYDYVTTNASEMSFPSGEKHREKSISLNDGVTITDWASFERYPWPDPEKGDFSGLDDAAACLPDGMKLMVMGPMGVLENVISLMGYDNLCFAIYEEPELVQTLFDTIGSRLLRYYEIAAAHEATGMLMSNDDWGFNAQTFLSPEHMRQYVFPWHRRIVEAGHRHGKPVLLHSCGNLIDVMEDVIDMGFDGKHSYEDKIMPVEDAYRRWHGRIAILGGIDVDFLIRSPIEAVEARCRDILALTAAGGYALGSGNSIPEYIPDDKYDAMRNVALTYAGV